MEHRAENTNFPEEVPTECGAQLLVGSRAQMVRKMFGRSLTFHDGVALERSIRPTLCHEETPPEVMSTDR